MLRKRVKDLETEYKQLQLQYQVKESRVLDLESDVEVVIDILSNITFHWYDVKSK